MKMFLRKAINEIAISELVIVGACFIVAIALMSQTTGAALPQSEARVLFVGLVSMIIVVVNLVLVLPFALWVLRTTTD